MKDAANTNVIELKTKIESVLGNVRSSINSYLEAAQKSIGSNYNQGIEVLRSEISKLYSPIKDAIDDLKGPIQDMTEAADNLSKNVSGTLNTLKDDLEDSYEEFQSSNRKDIQKTLSGMKDSVERMIDDLSVLAVKFTDYDKEKEIVERLEKLCK